MHGRKQICMQGKAAIGMRVQKLDQQQKQRAVVSLRIFRLACQIPTHKTKSSNGNGHGVKEEGKQNRAKGEECEMGRCCEYLLAPFQEAWWQRLMTDLILRRLRPALIPQPSQHT